MTCCLDKHYSNTTNVKVKPPKSELSLSSLFDSNTTNVKVKHFDEYEIGFTEDNSNTTNVKVKPVVAIPVLVLSMSFKYNQC